MTSLFLHALDAAAIPFAGWALWKLVRDPWGTR
jgi:hypothetical protein